MRVLAKVSPVLGVMALAVAMVPVVAQSKFEFKSLSVDLPSGTRLFPAGPGASVIDQNCLGCHSAGMVLNQPDMTKAAWAAEVNKMRHVFMAPVDEKDVPAIVAYLVAIKGRR